MKIIPLFFTILVSLSTYSQTWVQKASLPIGTGLLAPCSFSINGKIYVGGGDAAGGQTNAFYMYDPSLNTWTQMANMPATLYNTGCFALNGKGYVVVGATPSLTNSVYQYDPSTNTWRTLNLFPGGARSGPVGFSFHGKGYLFAGFLGGSSNINDMWEYNDTTDSWTQKASAPGPGRNNPAFLVVNNQAFVGLGATTSGNPVYSDMYQFDPVANSYTQIASIPTGRQACANFSVGSYGYIGLGDGGSNTINDFWKYDPIANAWTQVNNFGGPARGWVFNETVSGLPYVGCGSGYNGSFGPFFMDNWTWTGGGCNLNLNLGNDTTLCVGNSITLRDTFSNATSLWSTGATSATITVSSGGTYWLKVTQGSCTVSDTINVSFVSGPASAGLGSDTTLCSGSTLILDATVAGASYLWQNGSVNPTFTVSTPGIYWVDVTANGCTNPDSIVINYISPPVLPLGGDTTICEGGSLTLNAQSATYLWSDGVTTAFLSPVQSGTYTVTASNACGSATASENISVVQCVCQVAIPDAFTPNNDGKNDSFGVLTQCPIQDFEINIYNRWGQKVFSANDLNTKWDGIYKGVPQPIGVYVYMVKYRDPYTGENHSQSGNVTLLR